MPGKYRCPRPSDADCNCKCRAERDGSFTCIKPNPWNEFRRKNIGKYRQRELSKKYASAKREGFALNICNNIVASCDSSVVSGMTEHIREDSTKPRDKEGRTAVWEVLQKTPPISQEQIKIKWQQAYNLCNKIKWPSNIDGFNSLKVSTLHQCAKIIDKIFYGGAVLGHILTFYAKGPIGRKIYWDMGFRTVNDSEIRFSGAAVTGTIKKKDIKPNRKGNRNKDPWMDNANPYQYWVTTNFHINVFTRNFSELTAKGYTITNDGFPVHTLEHWFLHVVCHEMAHAVFTCVLGGTSEHDQYWCRLTEHIYGATTYTWDWHRN